MGDAEGTALGAVVVWKDVDGWNEEIAVGLAEGTDDGGTVGGLVGLSVGEIDGTIVDGWKVGGVVVLADGQADGAVDGETVGD